MNSKNRSALVGIVSLVIGYIIGVSLQAPAHAQTWDGSYGGPAMRMVRSLEGIDSSLKNIERKLK